MFSFQWDPIKYDLGSQATLHRMIRELGGPVRVLDGQAPPLAGKDTVVRAREPGPPHGQEQWSSTQVSRPVLARFLLPQQHRETPFQLLNVTLLKRK